MNPELRKELEAVMPYEAPPPGAAAVDMANFAINNVVFTIHYSNGAGEMPLTNPWRLAGGPLGSMLRYSERDAHYHTKARIGGMTIALIMHPHLCIVSGVRSYLVLLVVCNMVTKYLRRVLPQCASFHFHSFINQMQNSVCRVSIDVPLNFDRLQSIIKPEFTIKCQLGDHNVPAIGKRRNAPRANLRNNLKIIYHELAFMIPKSRCQRKPVEVVLKFYYSASRSVISINGVHSIYLAYELLKDIVAFLLYHRSALTGATITNHVETNALQQEKRALSKSLMKAHLQKSIVK